MTILALPERITTPRKMSLQRTAPLPRAVQIHFEQSQGKCWYCGELLDHTQICVDHFIPKCAGGKNHNNLVPSCFPCNAIKGQRSISEFRAAIAHKKLGIPPFSRRQHAWLRSVGFSFPETIIEFWFETLGLSLPSGESE